jgi:hypothetical protein
VPLGIDLGGAAAEARASFENASSSTVGAAASPPRAGLRVTRLATDSGSALRRSSEALGGELPSSATDDAGPARRPGCGSSLAPVSTAAPRRIRPGRSSPR